MAQACFSLLSVAYLQQRGNAGLGMQKPAVGCRVRVKRPGEAGRPVALRPSQVTLPREFPQLQFLAL